MLSPQQTNSILRICFSSYILFILNAVSVCFYYVFLFNILYFIFFARLHLFAVPYVLWLRCSARFNRCMYQCVYKCTQRVRIIRCDSDGFRQTAERKKLSPMRSCQHFEWRCDERSIGSNFSGAAIHKMLQESTLNDSNVAYFMLQLQLSSNLPDICEYDERRLFLETFRTR